MKKINCQNPEYGCMCMDFSCICCQIDYDGNCICMPVKKIMKKFSLEQKFHIIKSVAAGSSIGIHNFGLLHDIADALNMKGNSGTNLRSLNARISRIMRQLIEAGYPIKEYRIKCCSWTEKETWHAMFSIKEN